MHGPRKSSLVLGALGAGVAAFGATFLDATLHEATAQRTLALERQAVEELGLTDLCLFTEARYTRHLSQADLHTAFQDHPLSLDHFPSGSLVGPPPGVTGDD